MEELSCNFCNKIFVSKQYLNKHQKTAKYCLEKQGIKNEEYKCEYCSKILSTYRRLNTHINVCKLNKNEQNHKKEEELNKYKCLSEQIEEELKKYKSLLKQKEEEFKKYKFLSEKKEKEELNNYKILLSETKMESLMKDKIIEELKSNLEKSNNTISEIAKQPKIIHTNSHNDYNYDSEDEDEKLPSTVYEKLNEAIDTIEDIKDTEEKDNILTISTFTLNNITITSRHPDHYVNATQLCQAGNKKFSHWISLDSTKDIITVLSSDVGIPASLLVDTKRGQTTKFNQCSWIHPDLAIQLAQWISPSFALQVSRWVRDLFNNGSIIIDIALLKTQEKQLNIKDQRIKQLEEACLSKQRRVEYKEKNVIYMLTTDDHLKRRTYIFGKAKNLTTRLGTYNKTCDHTVIYYRECKNDDDMSVIETLVLSKLRDYREKANRDRFILPDDKDVSFFTTIIDECIDFI